MNLILRFTLVILLICDAVINVVPPYEFNGTYIEETLATMAPYNVWSNPGTYFYI